MGAWVLNDECTWVLNLNVIVQVCCVADLLWGLGANGVEEDAAHVFVHAIPFIDLLGHGLNINRLVVMDHVANVLHLLAGDFIDLASVVFVYLIARAVIRVHHHPWHCPLAGLHSGIPVGIWLAGGAVRVAIGWRQDRLATGSRLGSNRCQHLAHNQTGCGQRASGKPPYSVYFMFMF